MPSRGNHPADDLVEETMASTEKESLYEYNIFHTSGKPLQYPTPDEDMLPPNPATIEGSHRSQSRRNAAGHADMQPSAFHSTQNELVEIQSKSQKSKASTMQDTTTQRPKRPRTFTEELKSKTDAN